MAGWLSYHPPKSVKAVKNPHCPRLLVIAGASTLCGGGNSSLKVDDADKGYNGEPKKWERLF